MLQKLGESLLLKLKQQKDGFILITRLTLYLSYIEIQLSFKGFVENRKTRMNNLFRFPSVSCFCRFDVSYLVPNYESLWNFDKFWCKSFCKVPKENKFFAQIDIYSMIFLYELVNLKRKQAFIFTANFDLGGLLNLSKI